MTTYSVTVSAGDKSEKYEIRSTTVGQAAKDAITDFLHTHKTNLGGQSLNLNVSILPQPRVRRL